MSDHQNDSTTAVYRLGINEGPHDLTTEDLDLLLDWMIEDAVEKAKYEDLDNDDHSLGVQGVVELNAERLEALRVEIARRVEGAS